MAGCEPVDGVCIGTDPVGVNRRLAMTDGSRQVQLAPVSMSAWIGTTGGIGWLDDINAAERDWLTPMIAFTIGPL